jgi:PadR family transcriptional regulator PadR
VSQKSSGVVQGTLDMLILKTVALEPLHGYGVGLRIEQISKGVFRINAGSLFPAFRRLERQGLIKGEWRATENNRRAKYYMLTEEGPLAVQRAIFGALAPIARWRGYRATYPQLSRIVLAPRM